MAKKSTIDKVLDEKQFNEKEIAAFHDMISYAKLLQKGMEESLKSYIEKKVEGLVEQWSF